MKKPKFNYAGFYEALLSASKASEDTDMDEGSDYTEEIDLEASEEVSEAISSDEDPSSDEGDDIARQHALFLGLTDLRKILLGLPAGTFPPEQVLATYCLGALSLLSDDAQPADLIVALITFGINAISVGVQQLLEQETPEMTEEFIKSSHRILSAAVWLCIQWSRDFHDGKAIPIGWPPLLKSEPGLFQTFLGAGIRSASLGCSAMQLIFGVSFFLEEDGDRHVQSLIGDTDALSVQLINILFSRQEDADDNTDDNT